MFSIATQFYQGSSAAMPLEVRMWSSVQLRMHVLILRAVQIVNFWAIL
jgi:hypothetical protein